jgi:hypothetical protein
MLNDVIDQTEVARIVSGFIADYIVYNNLEHEEDYFIPVTWHNR